MCKDSAFFFQTAFGNGGAARIWTGVTSARGSSLLSPYSLQSPFGALAPGPNPARDGSPNLFMIDWGAVKADFEVWLETKNYDVNYRSRILSELTKRVGVMSNPMDVIKLFQGLTHGQQHNLNRAIRALLNFYEETRGVDESWLKPFRKAIPKDVIGADLTVPIRREIEKSLEEVTLAPVKYQALYNLLFDSGLRKTEACRLINRFEGIQKIREGIFRCPLGYFRGTKLAYFAYFTADTWKLIKKVKEQVRPASASAYFYKRGYVAGKYLRKFAFDTMISLNISESVADFIQGRVPLKIGAKHYMALMRRADQFYPRYAKYITGLRQKALN